MADVRPPQEWISREVSVVYQGRIPEKQGRVGPVFDSNSGTLADANELGVTLEQADGSISVIPWAAIRRVTLRS
jgi:hypothetical protein